MAGISWAESVPMGKTVSLEPSSELLEKEQDVLQSLRYLSKPNEYLQREQEALLPLYTFSYRRERAFQNNPVSPIAPNLSGFSPELTPFGPPTPKEKRRAQQKERFIIAQTRQQKNHTQQLRDREQEILDQVQSSENGGAGGETAAISPFLAWIRETREDQEKNAKTARETFKDYRFAQPEEKNLTGDIFLNIRFPYRGSEEPPPSSAAIYTTPET